MFEITDVKILKTNDFNLKGVATITINNCFVVKDIKIVESEKKTICKYAKQKKTKRRIYGYSTSNQQ